MLSAGVSLRSPGTAQLQLKSEVSHGGADVGNQSPWCAGKHEHLSSTGPNVQPEGIMGRV